MVIFYKNSVLASIVSILGCLAITIAVVVGLETGIDADGISLIVVGVALAVAGKVISKNKQFKTWWKQVTDAKLDEAMKTDANLAVKVYNKNPKKRTLKMIAQLNPAAAQYIEAQKAKK